ncbi:TldD/PmbA family protein [Sphingomonas oligoaromativorans]|uniref:TldD/PmbA family protein n=1 Tax=Sphingomonas oligoaromativorans TaxID=575322 RepID=UPI00142396DB|nr:TldD/PmbA family protein [Sphingomonas oligoaromativorans]NIJ34892.1 PmbA protein [Sphingomonas oligoaromativorans]
MLTVAEAQSRVHDLVASAKRAGADAADALYVCNESTAVSVRLGALEDVERSEGETIGLRLFVGRRSASVSSSDLSSHALDTLVERAVAMAREAPEDAYAGLAPEDRLASGPGPDVDGDDGAEVSPQALRARAEQAEEAARAVAGVTNSEGASASAGRTIIALATSHGFAGGYATSGHGCSASVIAGEGASMQRDYAYRSSRHLADLEGSEAIGRRAGERAVARLDPVKIGSGTMPILFDPRVGSSMLGHLAGAITGSSIARRTSFLLDALETEVFARGISIIDDPHRVRGLGSKPFDGEGLPTARRVLIEDGVLTGWLLDSASARQLGLQPTGNAQRGIGGPPGAGTTNFYMAPGALSPAELMADVKRGLYVTELIGHGVNGVTGDYSRGAAGFLIEDGKIGPAVAEITIAGNLKEMFRAIVPADDLKFERAMDVPTLRIDGMTVAGA